ncbi:MAG: hypothetical protein ACI9XO_002297 [Paraglaciecola sp.]|jgi:hypothetical protein
MKSIYFKITILCAFTGFFLFSIGCGQEEKTTEAIVEKQPEKVVEIPENALFELIAPEDSGVNFTNNITENHQINIITNSYIYNGGGVAILDVNNDGLQDIYFTSSQKSNKLYLNKGNFKFEDVTDAYGVGAKIGFKTGVTVVDINADGWQDLYVCRSGTDVSQQGLAMRQNLLFVNNGGKNFTEEAQKYGIADASASNHGNFFDYDLDGDLDLYVMNHPIEFSTVNKISAQQNTDGTFTRLTAPRDAYESDKLFKNNGNGIFTLQTNSGISNRAFGLSCTVSDFNEDGYPDLFIGNDYIEPDLLYINNKNGTFTDKAANYFRHTSNHTMGVDIADFNNDGRVDLAALDMISEDKLRQKKLMSTMMTDRYRTLVKYHYGHQIMRNTLQMNNGNGSFSEIGTLAGMSDTDWSWACLFADFDNDTYKDLFITNGYRRDVTDLDYLSYTVDSINQSGGITSARFPDFNDYLKLIPSTKLPNYMYQNDGGIGFNKVSNDWGLSQKSYSNGAAYADLDNDGDLDLLVNNIHSPAFVYRNKAEEKESNNYLQIKLKGSTKNPNGTGASVKISQGQSIQYQELTPTRGFFSSVEYLLHFGLGNQAKIDKIEVNWGDGKMQTLKTIEGNQRLVINHKDAKKGNISNKKVAAKYFKKSALSGVDFNHQENAFSDFDREGLIPHKLSNIGPSLAIGDVNNDGLEDFFIGNGAGFNAALFVQKKNATFQKKSVATWIEDARFEDVAATFFDADGDKDLDLYVVSGGNAQNPNAENYQDRLYFNDGNGNFSKSENSLPQILSSGASVAAHDFDKDGDLDLVVGGRTLPGQYPTSPRSFLLANNGGKFTDVTAQKVPDLQNIGMVSDMIWANVDGDEDAELLIVGEWMPLTIFNVKNGQFQKKEIPNSTGWWNCLEAADFDGDGDLDLVAGNEGLNNRFHATTTEPLQLYAKDFDNNGAVDPILVEYFKGKPYPVASRNSLIKQLPILKKKFVRHETYSTATIDQVFSKTELESAAFFKAETLATSYFENIGNGNFKQKSLPLLAQVSPTNSCILKDANGDGQIDILLAGNSYAPSVETGRYDAGNGLLLLGTGKGDFTVVEGLESGFWASKETRHIAEIKLANGENMVLVANNQNVLEGFIAQ